MSILIALVAILPLVSDAIDGQAFKLTPRYSLGQEFTFHGKLIESSLGDDGVRFEQPFELEASMLVLEIDAKRVAEVGCFTLLRVPDFRPTKQRKAMEGVSSAHFDLVHVAPSGKATWGANDAEIFLPPTGRSPWELGYLWEMPAHSVKPGEKWMLRPIGQPIVFCELKGTETIVGVPCLKVTCQQQSQNWAGENAGLPAWKNDTTLWLDRKTGYVQRMTRDFQVRDPGATRVSRSILVNYDLASNLQYHGQAFMDRDADFRVALAAQNQLEAALANLEKTPPARFQEVHDKLDLALKQPSASPYRVAMSHLLDLSRRAIENRDSIDLEPGRGLATPASHVGRRARPFAVHSIETGQSISLGKVKGQAVVLVFIDPSAPLCLDALRDVLRAVAANEESAAKVLAVCTRAVPENLEAFRETVPGRYEICAGKGLDKAYAVDAVPHTIFIDSAGYLRGSFVGSGPELLGDLSDSLAEYGKRSSLENVGGFKRDKETFLR